MKTTRWAEMNHPFFHGMSEKNLRTIASLTTRIHFAQDSVVFREGDSANWFYFIQDGRLALESVMCGRRRIAVQTIGPGEVLGWSWLFEPFMWHFDARATAATDALVADAKRLREECDRDAGLGYELTKRIAQVVIDRLQATQLRLRNFHGERGVETWKQETAREKREVRMAK